MKNIKKIVFAAAVALAMATTTLAGNIPTKAGNIPTAVEPGNIPTAYDPGNIPTISLFDQIAIAIVTAIV